MFYIKKILFSSLVFCSFLFSTDFIDIQLNGATLQADGKIVACGNATISGITQVLIVRYNTNGSLDTTFGSTGIVTTAVGNFSESKNLVVQSDGKIVVCGSTVTSVSEFLVIRYSADGSLDTTFNGTGIATFLIGSANAAKAIGLQSDDKIIVVGSSINSGLSDFVTIRLINDGISDGTLDTSYGTSGSVTTSIGTNDLASGLVIQSDDKAVVGGQTNLNGLLQFALARYTTAGILDSTFNTTGIVTTSIGTNAAIQDLALQPTGQIVVGGYSDRDFTLARYTSLGALDGSFGTGGIVTTDIGKSDIVNSIVIQSTGEIVASGTSDGSFALAGYTSAGVLNTSFGTNGLILKPQTSLAQARALVLQTDGKLIPAGFSDCGALLFRFSNTGTIDSTFGNNGTAFRPKNNTCPDVIDELVFNAFNIANSKGQNPNATFFIPQQTTEPSRPPVTFWSINKSTLTQDPLSLIFQIPKNFDNTGSVEVTAHLWVNDTNIAGNSAALRLWADFKNNVQDLGASGFSQTVISDDISITPGNIQVTISLDASTIAAQDWALLIFDRTAPSVPANEYDADMYLSSISFRYDQTAIN